MCARMDGRPLGQGDTSEVKCVCVCVCERERERERENAWEVVVVTTADAVTK